MSTTCHPYKKEKRYNLDDYIELFYSKIEKVLKGVRMNLSTHIE